MSLSLSGWRKESNFLLSSHSVPTAGRLSQKLCSDFYLLWFFQTGEALKEGISGSLSVLDTLQKGLDVTTRVYPACSAWQVTWPESLKNQYLRIQQTPWPGVKSSMTSNICCYQSLWQKKLESEKNYFMEKFNVKFKPLTEFSYLEMVFFLKFFSLYNFHRSPYGLVPWEITCTFNNTFFFKSVVFKF